MIARLGKWFSGNTFIQLYKLKLNHLTDGVSFTLQCCRRRFVLSKTLLQLLIPDLSTQRVWPLIKKWCNYDVTVSNSELKRSHPNCSSTLNIVAMILYVGILNVWRHVREKLVAVRGEGGVAGEGRVVGIPKFPSWGKYTMPLMNINSDWMSNASSVLCINLYYNILRESFISHPLQTIVNMWQHFHFFFTLY